MKQALFQKLQSLAEHDRPVNKKVVVGFDAVVDRLCRVVREQSPNGSCRYFRTMGEFGGYLIEKSGLSCCVQLETIQEKMGGNMAILSAALLQFGIRVEMIGTLQDTQSAPLFRPLADGVTHSIGKPGSCLALEFTDGKVMMAGTSSLDFTFEQLCRQLGRDLLVRRINEADLLCLVNWSELREPNDIWRGMLSCFCDVDKQRVLLLDLADCSSFPRECLLECIAIVQQMNQFRKTVLSLNENEGMLLAAALDLPLSTTPREWGELLAERLQLDITIIHTSDFSYAWDLGGRCWEHPSYFTKAPAFLTGGGDNFNAGFCLGLLHGLDIQTCLLLANANSGYYVRSGCNTDLKGLLTFIQNNQQ